MNTTSLEICPVCVKKVKDDEEGLQCDDPCNRWFHRQCANVPKTEYTKIASNTTIKWYCTRADCVHQNTQVSPDISTVLSTLIGKVDSLATMVNKLSDVPDDTKIIKTEIQSIQEKLNTIEPKLEELDRRLTTLEQSDGSGSSLSTNSVIEELHERNLRKKNLIVFNAPESTNNLPQDIKVHDTSLLTSIIHSAIPDFDVSRIKFFRLGSRAAGKPRPIKLIFPSEGDMNQVLSSFSTEQISSLNPSLKDVKLSRDRTPLELSSLRDLRRELELRLTAGEKDLTIKYRNGFPKIVKTNAPKKN